MWVKVGALTRKRLHVPGAHGLRAGCAPSNVLVALRRNRLAGGRSITEEHLKKLLQPHCEAGALPFPLPLALPPLRRFAILRFATPRAGHPYSDCTPGPGPGAGAADMYSDVHRGFSGFEQTINSLLEKTEIERDGAVGSYAYSLSPSGRTIAGVCAAWQETLDAATRSSLLARPHWAWAPAAWDPTRSCWETPAQPWATAQRVVVLVDNREPKPGLEHKLTSLCCEGVRYREETLATGDFLFLLEPAAEGNDSPLGGKRVLPVIIERKTPSDLASSLEDNRYQSQIRKMVASGLAIKVYLVEGKIDDLTPEQQTLLDELATTKGFHIVYTTNGWKTALTLGQIARLQRGRDLGQPAAERAPDYGRGHHSRQSRWWRRRRRRRPRWRRRPVRQDDRYRSAKPRPGPCPARSASRLPGAPQVRQDWHHGLAAGLRARRAPQQVRRDPRRQRQEVDRLPHPGVGRGALAEGEGAGTLRENGRHEGREQVRQGKKN